MTKKSVGFSGKSSPVSKKGRISYLLPHPFPQEEIILGKTKDAVLRFLYKGFNTPNKIANEIGIERTTIKQHLDELEKIGLVDFKRGENGKKLYAYPYEISEKGKTLMEKSVGFPVKSSHKRRLREGDLKTYTNRGHGYIASIKPDKKLNFKKILDELKIPYVSKTSAKIPRIMHNGKKVWLNDNQNKITIWFPKDESFFHKTPLKSRMSAEQELYEDMEELMEKFKINFTYRFKFTRVHNGDVSDERAKEFKSKGKTVYVYDEKGEWLTYDFSQKKYPEREVTRDDENLSVSTAFQIFENSNKKDGFLTSRPDNLKKKFQEIDETFNEFADRLKKSSEQGIGLTQFNEQLLNILNGLQKNQVYIIKEIKDLKDGKI